MRQKDSIKDNITNLKYYAGEVKKACRTQLDEDCVKQLDGIFIDILGAIDNAANLIEIQCINMSVNLENYLRLEEKHKNEQGRLL